MAVKRGVMVEDEWDKEWELLSAQHTHSDRLSAAACGSIRAARTVPATSHSKLTHHAISRIMRY